LQAISGNPDLYIRESGVPTTSHTSVGASGGFSLVDRSLTGSTSEYSNWVPLDGRSETRLLPGSWFIGVRAAGATNARYRLKISSGRVDDLALNNTVTNQSIVGNDWRYYRFTVPTDAPATWNLTFSQQQGNVVMWLRDTIPPGQKAVNDTSTTNIASWSSDNKNQGPYSALGQDSAGTYVFPTPPLRPNSTYYVGFRSSSDATFSFTTSTTGNIGAIPALDFRTGAYN
jgi:hypothetical protein